MTGACIRRSSGDSRKDGSPVCAATICTCRIRLSRTTSYAKVAWRISGELTWYPTEFSKLRLQYNHDFLEANDFFAQSEADSVFLQFEFILGAHGAHKF